MSTRPVPRPRPRPRPRVVANNTSSSSSNLDTTTAAILSPLEPVGINVVEDEDAMFFKNRNRTAQTWKKLNRLDEGLFSSITHSRRYLIKYDSDNENKKKPKRLSDDESEVEPVDATPRRKKQKRAEQPGSLPAWTRSEDAITYV